MRAAIGSDKIPRWWREGIFERWNGVGEESEHADGPDASVWPEKFTQGPVKFSKGRVWGAGEFQGAGGSE